jgi:hypothetical protein
MADPANILKSIGGNITGGKPTDTLGDIIHGIRSTIASNTATDPSYTADVQGVPYKVYTPHNALGETPKIYDPTNEAAIQQLLENAKPGSGILGLNVPTHALETGITDDEYETLQRESAKGNQLAMSLLDEYRPKYGDTATQFEQGLVQPIANDIKQLPGDFTSLEQQQEELNNVLPSNLAQVEQVASQYSGISPQAPNAQTSALMSQYGNLAQNAINAATPVMTAAYKDLGNAADISIKTFPYTTLIEDLLNRYAYQLESPSYPAPPVNMPGLPASIAKLFAASTGSELGASGVTAPSTVGTPDLSGITTPALQPASNPSSSG